MKTCSHCKRALPLEDFTINRSVKSGYGGHCKECHNGKNKNRHKVLRSTCLDYRASSLLRAAAQRTDQPVTITKEWVRERIKAGVCEATGLPFDLITTRPPSPFTPSLDKTDPKGGYTEDNVKVVCWIYNRAKGPGTHEHVLRLAEAMWKKSLEKTSENSYS